MKVLITGCSTGIGLAAAEHFAAKGYQVIATARNPESSEGLQSLIKSNDSVMVLPLDVTDQASVDATIKIRACAVSFSALAFWLRFI
jgi:NAD(P)-dependent dehydrogenase (short-subunit alcohol dehydrogenase family)